MPPGRGGGGMDYPPHFALKIISPLRRREMR